MLNRTKITVAFADALENTDVNESKVNAVLDRLRKAIPERIQTDSDNGNAPKNAKELEPLHALDNRNVARLFYMLGADPRAFLLAYYITPEERAKGGLPHDYNARNLKALAKLREIANLIFTGRMTREAVLHTWSACACKVARFGIFNRRVAEAFISGMDTSNMRGDLREAFEEYRAKHMTGGSATQCSQVTLMLYALGGLEVTRVGHSKEYKVKTDSEIMQALRVRYFGKDEAEAA